MGTPLRVLIVEDSEDDAILGLHELRRAGYALTSERVDTPQAMNAALDQQTWDIVLSDYAMPRFSMPAALAMVREKGLDLPFIIVSGAIGAEAAVAAMRAGAHDYVMKADLARLTPAVERELREAEMRRERERMEEALRESEEHYSALVGNLTDAVFHFKGGVITWCNDPVEEIYGYPKDELLGKSASFFYPGDMSPSEFTGRIAAAIKERGFFRSISRFQKKDGSFVDIEYSLSQIPGKDPIEVVAVARDITERRRIEEALRESEAHYRLLADNATDVIWTVDLDMRLTYISPSVTYLLGYSVEEAMGKSMEEVFTPASFEVAMKVLAGEMAVENTKQKDPARSRTLQIDLNRKDGSIVPVELNCTFLRESDGRPAEVLVIARDITERKRAEEQLRHSEEHFRSLIENAQDVILILNTDGSVRYESPSFKRLLGLTSADQIVSKPFQLVHPDDMLYAAELLDQLMQNPGVSIHSEVRVRNKDGAWRTLEVVGTNLLGNPAVAGIVANLRDITERKHAEEALRESEERLRALVENAPEAITAYDLDGTVIDTNKKAEELTGYSREELVGKNIFELGVIPEDYVPRSTKALAKTTRGVEARPFEFELIRKDGARISIDARTMLVERKGKVETICIARDITERKKAEEERKKMGQQLQLAGRLAAVGELAAGVAHELNNPLAAVQAFAQFLADRADLDEPMKSDVETIYREAQRASRITGSLLSFARRHKLEKQLISINETIEKSLELHAYRMKLSNIEVVMELAPDLPMTMADSDQMHQVFVNIITNAEQAMTAAHGRGRLCVKTQSVGGMIRIAFADNGPGISEDNLKRIFDQFFTTKDVGKGTGLGLSICYGIVEEHGGRLYTRSKLGKGATFVVELPIASGDQPVAEQASSIQG